MFIHKGTVSIKSDLIYTTFWPESIFDPILEQKYKAALSGKTLPVFDVSFDGSSYYVIGRLSEDEPFIWEVDKEDTTDYIPSPTYNIL